MADYKVSVALGLESAAFITALTTISRHLSHIHRQTAEIDKGFRAWGKSLMTGGLVTAGAGGGIIAILDMVSKKGDPILNMLGKLKLQGQSTTDVMKDMALAFEVTGKGLARIVPPEVAADVIKMMTGMTGHVEKAREMLPKVLDIIGLTQATLTKKMTPEQMTTEAFAAMKLLEEQGLFGPGQEAQQAKLLDIMRRGVQWTGGKVTYEMMRDAFLYSRQAGYGYTKPQALDQPIPFAALMPWMALGLTGRGGTGGLGPVLQAIHRAGVLGIMPRVTGKEWEKLGLTAGPAGRFRTPIDPKIAELFKYNPYLAEEEITKRMQARGMTPEQIEDQWNRMMPTGPGRAGMQFLMRGSEAIHGPEAMALREARGMMGIPDIAKSTDIAQTMPEVIEAQLASQATRMERAVGQIIDPIRLKVISAIADIFTALGNLALKPENAATIKAVSEGLLALGVALTTLGTTAILSGMVMLAGWPGVFASLATAILALDPKVRQAVKDLISAIDSADTTRIKEAAGHLALQCVASLVSGLVSIQDWAVEQIKSAVVTAFQRIKETITGPTMTPIRPPTGPTGLPPFLPPGLGAGGVPPWQEPIPPGPPPSLRGWRGGIPGGAPATTAPLPGGGISIPGSNTTLPWDFGGRGFPPTTGGGGLLQKQSWEPQGGGGGTVQINNVIYLDGQAVANAVHQYSIADMVHPRQGPMFDSRAGYTSPDSASPMI